LRKKEIYPGSSGTASNSTLMSHVVKTSTQNRSRARGRTTGQPAGTAGVCHKGDRRARVAQMEKSPWS
jgi:hypothetical protein